MMHFLREIQLWVPGAIIALALHLIVPSIALAHAGHDEKGVIDLMTTLQVSGVVAALGGGYFIISRLARRGDGDGESTDPA